MKKQTSSNPQQLLVDLEKKLEEIFIDKAPYQLPDNAKEMIVKYGPWISLFFIIITLPAILVFLGLGTIFAPFAFLGGVGSGVHYGIGLIFIVLTLILEIIAIPGLFKRSISSWRLMFYATLLQSVDNLINFNIGGLIMGTLLSLYILFQVKSYYK